MIWITPCKGVKLRTVPEMLDNFLVLSHSSQFLLFKVFLQTLFFCCTLRQSLKDPCYFYSTHIHYRHVILCESLFFGCTCFHLILNTGLTVASSRCSVSGPPPNAHTFIILLVKYLQGAGLYHWIVNYRIWYVKSGCL